MLEDGDAIFSPQPPNLLCQGEDGWLVVTLQGDCLAARAIKPIRHTLRDLWCGIAFPWNRHRLSPYFAPAPMRIGLLPWSSVLLTSVSGRPEQVSTRASGLFALRNPWSIAR